MDGSKSIFQQTSIPEHASLHRFLIRSTETDFADQLHLHALLSMLQESAYENALTIGVGPDVLEKDNLCWILRRTAVRMDCMPGWGETIVVKTWSRGYRRIVFDRDFIVMDDKGRSIGAASTEWLLADYKTRKLQRPDQFFPGLVQEAGSRSVLSVQPGKPQKAKIVSGEPLTTRTAEYCDIDRNGHVNNTRYAAWCMDAIQQLPGTGLAPDAMVVKGFDIHYVAELKLGQEVSLYGRITQNSCGRSVSLDARRTHSMTPVFSAVVDIV